MSFKQIYYQIIFGTKHRKPVIAEEHSTELYRYFTATSKIKIALPILLTE